MFRSLHACMYVSIKAVSMYFVHSLIHKWTLSRVAIAVETTQMHNPDIKIHFVLVPWSEKRMVQGATG